LGKLQSCLNWGALSDERSGVGLSRTKLPLIWNSNVRYSAYMSSHMVPNLSHTLAIHTLQTHLWKIYFNIILTSNFEAFQVVCSLQFFRRKRCTNLLKITDSHASHYVTMFLPSLSGRELSYVAPSLSLHYCKEVAFTTTTMLQTGRSWVRYPMRRFFKFT
jgi:hypothetical protein